MSRPIYAASVKSSAEFEEFVLIANVINDHRHTHTPTPMSHSGQDSCGLGSTSGVGILAFLNPCEDTHWHYANLSPKTKS